MWLEDEGLIDVVTAVSGSGPAYFFRFAEALSQAGRALGLPPEIAERLARRTLEGSGALAAATDRTLADLRPRSPAPPAPPPPASPASTPRTASRGSSRSASAPRRRARGNWGGPAEAAYSFSPGQ